MSHAAPDFKRIEVLTFDCYGTLIDWEAGIVSTLRAVLGSGGTATDGALLEAYAGHDARLETGSWRPYGEVVGQDPLTQYSARNSVGNIAYWRVRC